MIRYLQLALCMCLTCSTTAQTTRLNAKVGLGMWGMDLKNFAKGGATPPRDSLGVALLVEGEPRDRAARLAEDAGKISRHRAAVRKRREEITSGAKPVANHAKIFAMERLSYGRVMIAWEEPKDYQNIIDWSDAPEIRWNAERIPDAAAFEGVGEFSDLTTSARRYYSVDGTEDGWKTANEMASWSGTLTVSIESGTTPKFTVSIKNERGEPATIAPDFYVDGEEVGGASRETAPGVHVLELPVGFLTPGEHLVHAGCYNVWDGPTGEDTSGWGNFRTADKTFTVPAGLDAHAVGFRLTDPDLDLGEIEKGAPKSHHFIAELPAETYDRWTLAVHDSDGKKVREWRGKVDRKTGLSLSVPWDEKLEDGSDLPADIYQGQLTLGYPGGSVTLKTP